MSTPINGAYVGELVALVAGLDQIARCLQLLGEYHRARSQTVGLATSWNAVADAPSPYCATLMSILDLRVVKAVPPAW